MLEVASSGRSEVFASLSAHDAHAFCKNAMSRATGTERQGRTCAAHLHEYTHVHVPTGLITRSLASLSCPSAGGAPTAASHISFEGLSRVRESSFLFFSVHFTSLHMQLLLLLLLLPVLAGAQCVPAAAAARQTLAAQRCSFWQRDAVVGNTTFVSRCDTVSYSDLDVVVAGTAVGYTDKKTIALTDTVRFYACGREFAVLEESAASRLSPVRFFTATYTLTVGSVAIDVLLSTALTSRTLAFTNTDGVVLANVSVTGGQLVEGSLCLGATWTIVCAADADVCRAVMYTAAWYALKRSTQPPCNSVYWFLSVGMPLFTVAMFVAAVLYARRRCAP